MACSKPAKARNLASTWGALCHDLLVSRRQDTENLVFEVISERRLKYEYEKHATENNAPLDAKGNECCLRRAGCSLNRSVLRQRWQDNWDSIGYDFDAFSFCIRSRILVQPLGEKVIIVNRAKRCLGMHAMVKDLRKGYHTIAKAYHRLLPFCQYEESTNPFSPDYPTIVIARLSAFGGRKDTSFTVMHTPFHDPMTPGPRIYPTAAEGQTHICSLLRLLPDDILDKPTDRRTCWHCGRQDVATQVCGSCNFARFCSQACQESAWPSHKATCKEAKRRVTPYTRKLLEGASSEGVHTYRELVSRCVAHLYAGRPQMPPLEREAVPNTGQVAARYEGFRMLPTDCELVCIDIV